MKVYIYDDTFKGYLTAIFKWFENKDFEDDVCRVSLYGGNLIHRPIDVFTDEACAARVVKGVLEKLGYEWLDMIHAVFLSELPEADMLGARAMRLGFKYGKSILNDERHEVIQPFLKVARAVKRETHSFLGFVRFSKLDSGIYYASCHPTYNILVLLAPHFADRMGDQSWVIHDTGRGIAAFYNQSDWHINTLNLSEPLLYAEDEMALRNNWRGYFEAVTISERVNLKLQQQKIPKKYWKYFTEDIGVLNQNTIE